MRVILTRPAGSNEALAAKLEAAGFKVLVRPLIAIAPLELGAEARQLAQNPERFAAAVFVSRQAVRYGMAALERDGAGLPASLAIYAVGPGTAAALAPYGVAAVAPETPGSEGLLALPALQGVAGKDILIVKGRGGRALLQDSLAARGARVACLECYRRAPCPLADLPAAAGEQLLALTSGDILDSFIASKGQAASRFTAVVPSARVAALARRHPFKKVVNAGAATDEALYHSLVTLRQQADG